MKLSIKALKDAFWAECNRAANFELGISTFRDYEIAHFINMAYMLCINKRIGLFDERFVPTDKRSSIDPRTTAFPASMRLLQDFGDLYVPTGMIAPELLNDNGFDLGTCGENTFFFRIPKKIPIVDTVTKKVIGNKDLRETPYLVNVSLHEYKEQSPEKPDTSGRGFFSFLFEDNNKKIVAKRTHTQLCRPINPVDVTRMALSYQDDKYMPYVYYRVRPIKYYIAEDGSDKDHSTKGYYIDDFVEVSYSARNGGDVLMMHIDMICYPNQITEQQIKDDSEKEFIEVMFGYEIAQMAASIAMESLGSGRSQSLQQQALASEPQ